MVRNSLDVRGAKNKRNEGGLLYKRLERFGILNVFLQISSIYYIFRPNGSNVLSHWVIFYIKGEMLYDHRKIDHQMRSRI